MVFHVSQLKTGRMETQWAASPHNRWIGVNCCSEWGAERYVQWQWGLGSSHLMARLTTRWSNMRSGVCVATSFPYFPPWGQGEAPNLGYCYTSNERAKSSYIRKEKEDGPIVACCSNLQQYKRIFWRRCYIILRWQ